MTQNKKYEDGIKKINASDSKEYLFQNKSWKYSNEISNEIKKIIDKYATKENLHLILDDITQKFIKGHITKEKKISGDRIKHLPNGSKIARGGFSIYAKNLIINDNDEKYLWDVSYENTSGLKTYLYSADKIHLEKEKKKKQVDKFIEKYPKIITELEKDLIETSKIKYLALYTLLKTHIRVGSLHHYNQSGHKGLTTLQKKDIVVDSKMKKCTFEFIGKDGVPQKIEKEFPDFYLNILSKRLKKLKKNDFVFICENNLKPLHSSVFSDIMFKYTNEHFYPHIIRSFYADITVKHFIDQNSKKKLSKKDVDACFLEVAKNLGHKKYNKNKDKWEINFKVTIDSYIRDEYVKLMKKLYSKDETKPRKINKSSKKKKMPGKKTKKKVTNKGKK